MHNIKIMGITEREESEKGAESSFKEIITRTSRTYGKNQIFKFKKQTEHLAT